MFGIFGIGQTFKQQIQSDLAQILGDVTVLQGQMGTILNSLANVGQHLKLIEHQEAKILAQVDDLNAAVAQLNQEVTDTATRVDAQLTTLEQQLAQATANQTPPPDLSGAIASIRQDVAALANIGQSPASTTTPSTTSTS